MLKDLSHCVAKSKHKPARNVKVIEFFFNSTYTLRRLSRFNLNELMSRSRLAALPFEPFTKPIKQIKLKTKRTKIHRKIPVIW